MNNRHTIVYVMKHVDIGGLVDIPYKKIGITGKGDATLDGRRRELSTTQSPIKTELVIAWEHEKAYSIEYALHQLLADERIDGEWFLDTDETLIRRLKPMLGLLGAKIIFDKTDVRKAYKQDQRCYRKPLRGHFPKSGDLITVKILRNKMAIGVTLFSALFDLILTTLSRICLAVL